MTPDIMNPSSPSQSVSKWGNDNNVRDPFSNANNTIDFKDSGSSVTIDQFNTFVQLQRIAKLAYFVRQDKKHKNMSTFDVY
jgi:hypothetical protein